MVSTRWRSSELSNAWEGFGEDDDKSSVKSVKQRRLVSSNEENWNKEDDGFNEELTLLHRKVPTVKIEIFHQWQRHPDFGMLKFDFLRFHDVLLLFLPPKNLEWWSVTPSPIFFTVNNRSRFMPMFKHFASRHAEQRRRVSTVISQWPFRRHWNVG